MQRLQKLILLWTLFGAILMVALWIRVQGVTIIPEGQFTGNDPYLHYWQAQIISEHGRLPERDMHRWVPLGRDLGQSLNAYSYAIAYSHQAITTLFPNVSLYHISLLSPAVCFVLGLGALCLFLYRTNGTLFSSIVGILLATLPGAIERSAVGFSDRDSWCLMLGILTIITYLASLRAQRQRIRILWTLASGGTMFLGGMSWEGFGVFLSIILCVELWKFLTTEKEDGLRLYVLWVLTFVPSLYLASPAYRDGEGFATHIFAFMLVPPMALLGIRVLRHFLLTKTGIADKFHLHARNLSLGLTLVSFVLALGYIWGQLDTFENTTVPLSQNQLMQSVGELGNPNYQNWVFQYGSVFFLGSVGFIIVSIYFWRNSGTVLGVMILLYTLAAFFRTRLEAFFGKTGCDILFFASLGGIILVLFFIAWRRRKKTKQESIYLAMAVWFLLWVTLAHHAHRYSFYIGLPIAFFTAELICHVSTYITENLKRIQFLGNNFKRPLPLRMINSSIATFIVVSLMFWPLAGEHAKRETLTAASIQDRVTPGDTPLAKAFEWMKSELPETAIVAAEWDYGSQLNVLGGVKTVIDQDHYIQHWIHLYNKHVLHATDATEALRFLKTHGVTHLMLVYWQTPEVFQQDDLSDVFVPTYPIDKFMEADVKVWRIHYPPDIQPISKYLATEQR